jgi:hypothetical protein
MLDLEKPATAYLLEIDVALTSSTLDRTRKRRTEQRKAAQLQPIDSSVKSIRQ